MTMRWLMQEWIVQWLGIRSRPRDRAGGEPDSWWLAVRERILRFLVARYVEGDPEAPPVEESPPPIPVEERRTFCRVKPEDHPPRKCEDMASKLHSVSRINESKQQRWRWW